MLRGDDFVNFVVPGVPRQKGSKRAMLNRFTGKAQVLDDNRKTLRQWTSDVKTFAAQAWGNRAPLDRACAVELVFRMPRPKAHYRTNGKLKPNAPKHCAKTPDGDKLERAVWDALSSVVFQDDKLVAVWQGEKVYAEQPGVVVTVYSL